MSSFNHRYASPKQPPLSPLPATVLLPIYFLHSICPDQRRCPLFTGLPASPLECKLLKSRDLLASFTVVTVLSMQLVLSNVCLNNPMLLNLFSSSAKWRLWGRSIYLTDWLPEMKRNYTTHFSPPLMPKKIETFGNQVQTLSWPWWPPLPGPQGSGV